MFLTIAAMAGPGSLAAPPVFTTTTGHGHRGATTSTSACAFPGRLQRVEGSHLRSAVPDGGVVGVPGSRHKPSVALCTTAYTVWPARVRGHPGLSGVGSGHFGGLLCAAGPAYEFNAWAFSTASQLGAAATGQRAPDRQGEQQSGAAFLLSFTDPVIHSPQPCAATATL